MRPRSRNQEYRPTQEQERAERRDQDRAQSPPRVERSALDLHHFLILLLLLLLPGMAMHYLAGMINWHIVLGGAVFAQLLGYASCRRDKLKAQQGRWRTPESTLHFIEVAGGWPGSYIAQRQFRHKISKRSYQATFWAIVVLHQYIALDFLMQWRLSSAAAQWVGSFL